MKEYTGWLIGVLVVLLVLWLLDVIRRKTANANPARFRVYRSILNMLYTFIFTVVCTGAFLTVALSGQALAWVGVALGAALFVWDVFFSGFMLTVNGSEVVYRNLFIKRCFTLGDIKHISKVIRRPGIGERWVEYRLHITGMRTIILTNKFVNCALFLQMAGFEP